MNRGKITSFDLGLELNDTIADSSNDTEDIKLPSTYNKPIVSFVDDDGTSYSYTRTYPIFKSKNISATFALVTDDINKAGYVTTAQLNEFVTDGFDLASHSKTHSDTIFNSGLATTTDAAIEEEFATSQAWFQVNGFNDCETIVYPFGNFDFHGGAGQSKRVKNLAKKYYKHGLNADGWYNTCPNDEIYINRYFPDFTLGMTVDDIKSVIDNCIANNGWLIIGIHAFNLTQFPDDKLLTIIDYIKSKGVDILNITEALEYKRNVMSIGEFTDLSKGLFIGRDGSIKNNSENCKIISDYMNYTTDSLLSSFAKNKLSIVNIEGSKDLISGAGGILCVYNGGTFYGYETYLSGYGQKIYTRMWDESGAGSWNPWTEITNLPIGVSTNSYLGVLDSPPGWYSLQKITSVYVKATDDNFKNVGGMFNIYHGDVDCSYATFEPINEFKKYKRVFNDTTLSWGTWNPMI